MDHFTILLLLLCGTTPFDVFASVDDVDVYSRNSIKDVSHMLDLYPRDGVWGAFNTEFRFCWNTWRQVYDAPPLADRLRFPPPEVCEYNYDLAQRHLEWLNDQKLLYSHRTGQYDQWTADAVILCDVWDKLRRSQWGGVSAAPGCRVKMAELRDLIGPEAYYAADWPPPVPHWYFQRR